MAAIYFLRSFWGRMEMLINSSQGKIDMSNANTTENLRYIINILFSFCCWKLKSDKHIMLSIIVNVSS